VVDVDATDAGDAILRATERVLDLTTASDLKFHPTEVYPVTVEPSVPIRLR
jgi:hypothetical protein